ncbi:hybrid sensor histidine kinase/response regulator [Noviherbaspirillum humi]|nr:ATP-binding protein [Noviherbaspirillum humi]
MKLRSYLVWIATASAIPLIVFAGIALMQLLQKEREAFFKTMRETANAIALAIDGELASAQRTLEALSTSDHLAAGDVEKFKSQAQSLPLDSAQWLVLYDVSGRQLMNTYAPHGQQPPAPPLPNAQVTTRAERVQLVAQTGTVQVTGLNVGTVSKQYAIGIDVPVTIDGQVRYVLSQVFLASHFAEAVSQRGVSPTWVVGIFDRIGLSIVRTPQPEKFIGGQVRSELFEASRRAHADILRHQTRDGIEVYDAFTHTQMSGWTVAVGVPVEEVESAARRAVLLSALGLIAAIIAAALASVIFGRRLADSIAAAAEASGRLRQQGPITFRKAPVREVAQLQQALRNAAEVIQESEAARAALLGSERQARAQAEKQNRLKDDFLAMLGHELRNPLAAICAAIDVLGSEQASAAMRARAQDILQRQSRHLTRILDDLLDVNRILRGKVTLNRQRLNLSQSVLTAIQLLRASGRDGRHDIRHALQPVWVDADATRLEQIISNLLTNAVKYTPEGGLITVTVREEDGQALLAISDSGVGIAPDILPHVFDPFVQAKTSLDRAGGGIGLGLSIVRQLVQLHGGSVSADSPGPGQGSTFAVRLPLNHAGPQVDVRAAPVESAGWRVLLVDDNDDSRAMLAGMLSLSGCDVLEAANAKDGIFLARTNAFDVAVIDIGLPDIDGYELAHRLRGDEATRALRLIALTGYGQDADRERAIKAGFDRHLVKPAEARSLIENIHGLLQEDTRGA